MKIKDTAFPFADQPGMDLRDYFAGQVIAGIAKNSENQAWAVKFAYSVADAMMKERENYNK